MTNRTLDVVTREISATVFIAALIAFLTLTPIPDPGLPATDKHYHLIAFATLTLPLSFARPKLAVVITTLAILYGGLIELTQPFFGREKEWLDFQADVVGAVLGSIAGAGLGLVWSYVSRGYR